MFSKRFLCNLFLGFLLLLSSSFAEAQTYKIRAFKHLTGGTDTSYVDGIDGDDLTVGDLGLVITSSYTYFYEVDESGDAESSPDVIAPDSNPGNKRWKLRGTHSVSDHESTYNHSNYDTAYGWGDHSSAGYASESITLTAGEGLTGGGDLSANRTFDLDINGLVADGTPDSSADYVATYDADAATHKKVLLDTLYGDVDHGGLLGLTDDDHTQYLLANGSRDLTGNMAVDAAITIDGVDISVFEAAYNSHLHDGDTLQNDGLNSDGGAFSFTTSGILTFSNTVALTTSINAGVDTDKFLVLDGTNNIDYRTGAEVLSDIGAETAGAVATHEATYNHANYNTAFGWGDHSIAGYALQTITLTAGVGLTGGGDLSANRTFDLDINGLVADAAPDGAADYVASYDADAATHKKILLDNFPVASHLHDGDTLQHDGVNSDGGAFSFTTTGTVTFSQSINLDTVGTDEYLIANNRALAMPVDNTNLAAGTISGASLSTGQYNVLLGYNAGNGITSGSYNIAVGDNSLHGTVTGDLNVAIGFNTLNVNTSGYHNVAIGPRALEDNTGGYYNVAVGMYCLASNTTAAYSVAIGYEALKASLTGEANIAIGYRALLVNTIGYHNVAIGYESLVANTEGFRNVAIGFDSLASNTLGDYNLALGAYSLLGNTEGSYNIGIGQSALRNVTTSDANLAIGYDAAYNVTSGTYNLAVGYNALRTNQTGGSNVAIGVNALYSSTSSGNVAININSLYDNTTGTGNIGIGYYTGRNNKTGSYNTLIGYQAAKGASGNSHSNNVALGYRSLYAVTTGSNNVTLGYQTGDLLTTGSSNIIIGYNVDPSANNATNELNIGYTLYGDLANGYIGVGKIPTARLELSLSTEDLQIVDAGSAGATEQDWIEVTVGGNQGYIRVFAAK